MRVSLFSLMIVIIIPSMLPGSCFLLGCLLSVNSRDLPPRQQPAQKPARQIRCASPGSWWEKKESELAKSWTKVNSLTLCLTYPTALQIQYDSLSNSLHGICSVPICAGSLQNPWHSDMKRGKNMVASLLARAGLAKHAAESDSFVHSPWKVWSRHLCQAR